MTEFSEMLTKAADYMEEHGSCAYNYVDSEGRVCVLGAILAAVGKIYEVHLFSEKVREAIRVIDPAYAALNPGISIAYWSDTHEHEHRVAVLRKAAEL